MQKNHDLRLLMKFIYWMSVAGIFSLLGYVGWMIYSTVTFN